MTIGQQYTFQRTETIICSLAIENTSGTAVNPDVYVRITITDPDDTAVVSAQDMVNDSTGNYHYDYTSAGTATLGRYKVKYTAVNEHWDTTSTSASPTEDTTRTTILYDYFELEA